MTDDIQFRTVRETAKILRMGLSTAYRAIADGNIKAVKIGGCVRIPPTEIERLSRGDSA
jgi:excisionase family DNA binding protein